MPARGAEHGLERVVVRSSDALDLVDVGVEVPPKFGAVSHVRAWSTAEMRLVDIQKAQKLAPFATHISKLEEGFANLPLNLQVEVDVIGRTEILVDAEDAAGIHHARECRCGND